MATIWVLEWTDTQTNETAICEVEGDRCYQCWTDQQVAQKYAGEMNAEAEARGWVSRYAVVEKPTNLNAKHFY